MHHPEAGDLEVIFQSVDLPVWARSVYDLAVYTAEHGTASEDKLKLLTSWAESARAAADLGS